MFNIKRYIVILCILLRVFLHETISVNVTNTPTISTSSTSSTGSTSSTNATENATGNSTDNSRGNYTGNATGSATRSTTEKIKERWVADALKDIAYYLRSYKFNEYDRRYETNPVIAPRRYFKEFPRPPLRSLHWEVHKHCEPSFRECIDYLRQQIRSTSLKRTDDTAVVMQEQHWTFANHTDQINQIDEECKKHRDIDNTVADPFEGPLERYQWRVTASYYMCWYTMQQIPEMEHLSESCDNFAYCLDTDFGPNNKDIRANDSHPYGCALYSFCPDPCCSNRHLTQVENCWNWPDNPCFPNNPPGPERVCAVVLSENTDFRDIVLNRWNVTCKCRKAGYVWNSFYGMCVDVNECAAGSHNCDPKLQVCVNLPGSFRCACIWGHIWSSKTKTCTPSEALGLIKLERIRDVDKGANETKSLFRRIVKFFLKSGVSELSRVNKFMLSVNLFASLLLIF